MEVYSDSSSNQTALSNDSMISAETINIGNKITLTAKAIGGTGLYKYKYYCKPETDSKYTALTGSTTETTCIHTPARAIQYTYAVKIADSKGKTSTKYFKVNVVSDLENNSFVSSESITQGQTITLIGVAAKGTGPYKYKYYCKPETDSKYTALTGSTTETTCTHTPARAIQYTYAVKIADSKRTTRTKYFKVKVNPTPNLNLNQTKMTMGVNETYTLKSSNYSNVSYSSSNINVVTVSKSGTITAKKPGNATITAKAKFGSTSKQAKCTITVKKAPTKFTLNRT